MNADDAFEVHLIIEELQGQLYAWDKFTNQFRGQGKTIADLFERLQEDIDEGCTVVFRISKEEGGQILYQRSLTEDGKDARLRGVQLIEGEDHG